MASCFGQRRQDSSFSWIVCACATLATAVTMGFTFSFGVLFPVLLDYFKESKDTTAWVGSLAIALIFFTGPLTGILINRLGCRTTSLVGAGACAVGLMLTSFSNSIIVMYFSYSVLFGPGTSLVFASALIIVAKYFDKRRGVATGIVGSGESFGIMSLGPILQTLLDAFGWRHTCRIMSAVIFVICLLSCFYNPDLEYDHKPTHVEEIEPLQEQDSEENPLLQKGKNKMQLNIEVWKNPAFVKITLLAAMVKFGQFSPAIHLVRYCEEIGISAESASRLFIYAGIAAIIGKILTGRLCDVEWANARYIAQAATFVEGTATILMTLSREYYVLVGYIIVFSLCEGLMADKLGSYVPAFYMVGGVIIFGSLIPFFLHCWKEETSTTTHRTTISTEYEQLQSQDPILNQ